MSEDTRIERFLAANGWSGAHRCPIAGDASSRRYERLSLGQRRAVLMDAPPGLEEVRPFMAIDRYLRHRGFSAPEIHGADEAVGLLLLEDLGRLRYTELIDEGRHVETLFEAAVDVLIALHSTAPKGLESFGHTPPVLDADRLGNQVEILLDMYYPAVTGQAPSARQRAEYMDCWHNVLPLAEVIQTNLVLYDYHAPNLMWLPDRRGVQRVGLLDFQDAMIGPVAFDLVSLLQNPRQDINPALAAAMTARYLAGRPEVDAADFTTACALLGAQRSTRNLGNFTRLWRAGKPVYLDHMERLWTHVEAGLAHPAMAPVAAWFNRELPPPLRRRPDGR